MGKTWIIGEARIVMDAEKEPRFRTEYVEHDADAGDDSTDDDFDAMRLPSCTSNTERKKAVNTVWVKILHCKPPTKQVYILTFKQWMYGLYRSVPNFQP